MEPFSGRTASFEGRLADAGADAAALAPGPNLYYLSGFAGEADRHLLLLVTAEGERTFVVPEQYAEQVAEGTWINAVRTVPGNSPELVAEQFEREWDGSGGRLLLDDRMTVEISHRLHERLPAASFGLATEVLGPMRLRKDETEIDALRTAAAVADDVSAEIRSYGSRAIGMTEAELAVDIRAALHERGCEGVAFPVSVGAGPNGARPTQHRHGDREIRPGDPVVIDFGGVTNHYASDQTRVVVFDGDPPDGFREAYDAVLEALRRGVDEITPGMTTGEADALVREVIEARGYGDEFTTGTGHGVGLRAHEEPAVAPGGDAVVREGMVFSVEPGVYLPGEFGVRLETLVVATDDGVDPLNTSPYTWRPLDGAQSATTGDDSGG